MKFHELLNFEEKNPHVWKIGLYEYPLWYTVRSKLLAEQVPTPSRLSVGMFKKIYPRLELKAIDTLITVVNRPDLLSICNTLHKTYSSKNILRLEEDTPISFTYQSALSWDIVRFILQKIVWIFFFRKFFKLRKELTRYNLDGDLSIYIKKHIGDVIYLQFINYCFRNFKRIFYTNGIIPDIAKFDRSGKYIEIQHGHISNQHPGYIGVPRINGTLMCWNESTRQRLEEVGYTGKITKLKIQPIRECGSVEPNVLFATVNSEQFITHFRSEAKYNKYFIKLHPKMTDPKIDNCSHGPVDYSNIRNAIVLGTSTILHHLACEKSFDKIILVPFFDRERSITKADYLALVLEEFPELKAYSTKIKVKRTDEF